MMRLISILTVLVFMAVEAVPLRALVMEPPPRVMIYPFAPTGDAGAYGWVGAGVQQSLLVEASRPQMAAFIVPATQPAIAPTDPVAGAASAGATIVVFGNYQINNGEIRLTGQVVETATHKAVAALSATGPVADLFKLEDVLGEQFRHVLPQPSGSETGQSYTIPLATDASGGVSSSPVSTSGYYYSSPATDYYATRTVIVPDYSYTYYPTYAYPVYYPSYVGGGCYPYVSGVGFVYGFDRFHGSRGRFDHDAFTHDHSNVVRFGDWSDFRHGDSRGFVGGGGFVQRPVNSFGEGSLRVSARFSQRSFSRPAFGRSAFGGGFSISGNQFGGGFSVGGRR